jgi:PDDEXK-like domain of unknown function (DUF3799)
VSGAVVITKPGFYFDVTPAQYFAEPCPEAALTNSGIRMLAGNKAPAKFAHWHPRLNPDAPTAKDSAAKRMGSLVHRLALDKGDDYEISPFDEYRSNEAKAWRDDVIERGSVPIKQSEMEDATAMADILRAGLQRAFGGREYHTEVVLAWIEETAFGPVWCRAMLDAWCPDLLMGIDLKTCLDASDEAIDKVFSSGYAVQDYWYLRGIERITKQYGRCSMPFLFIEKEAPLLTRVADSGEAFKSGAEMVCNNALSIFARCLSTNEWPGYGRKTALPKPWWLNECATLEYEEAA